MSTASLLLLVQLGTAVAPDLAPPESPAAPREGSAATEPPSTVTAPEPPTDLAPPLASPPATDEVTEPVEATEADRPKPAWDRPLASADWLREPERDAVLVQRSTGSVMTGLGLAFGIVAPVVALQPTRAFRLEQDGDLAVGAVAAPVTASLLLGLGGGALSFLGARSLSDAYLDRSLDDSDVGRRKIAERRRNLQVIAGVSLGLAGALLVAGVAEGAVAGSKWSDIVNREASFADVVDGRDVAVRASRSLALATALPSLVGLGVGLLLGRGTRGETARLVPTGSGLALRGRF